MNNEISNMLLYYVLLTPIVLFASHIFLNRYGIRRLRAQAPQILLIQLILFFNIVVLAGAGLIAQLEARDIGQIVCMLVFAFIVFNGVAYAYFHFFNMSETARRIRMLLQVQQSGPTGLRVDELERQYSQTDMIESRLDRLVHLNQLLLAPDKHYHVVGSTLLWAGGVMRAWRRLILPMR